MRTDMRRELEFGTGVIETRRAPRTFRELHEKCFKCDHPYHDHFNPDDECWCGCKHFIYKSDMVFRKLDAEGNLVELPLKLQQ